LVPLEVRRLAEGSYEVRVSGLVRHAHCSSEDVMRALGNYVQGLSSRLKSEPKAPVAS